jgi:ATP-dependent DNA helicase RecG
LEKVIMTHDELIQLIKEVQQHQCEMDDIEVKSASSGTPQKLYQSLSAFANRTGGGVILLGLNEAQGFKIVGVSNAHRVQEEISQIATSEMEPELRPEFTVEEIEGKIVVAVEVPAVPAESRPCYYKPAGLQKGTYIRVGNTNRLMTDYEIFGYVSARAQPVFDEEPIKDATIEDLDHVALESYIEKLRKTRPYVAYLRQLFEQVLTDLHILRKAEGMLCPSLAGLLMFGKYPQIFEPQLVITFLHYFGTTETEETPRGERFLDNRKFEGTIPEMIETAVNHVMASIRKGSLIEGLYRRDIPEYPEEALREAIVNAVAHRDYSNYVRGSYIQIRLFADRLEIQSPGGLFGNVSEETLEEEQSTRNRTLVRLMEDFHLVENRGSGIKSMIESMRQSNLEPPRFHDKRSSFWVILRNLTLMNQEAISWLNRFADVPLNDRQRLALIYLKNNKLLTNFDYQRLNHVDSVIANRELRGLVQSGLIDLHGSRRWAHYMLSTPIAYEAETPKTPEALILDFVSKRGFIKRGDCMKLLNLKDTQAKNILFRMREQGLLRQEGTRKSARYVLPT